MGFFYSACDLAFCVCMLFWLAKIFSQYLNIKSVFIDLVSSRISKSLTLHFFLDHVSHYFPLQVFHWHPESFKTYLCNYFSNPLVLYILSCFWCLRCSFLFPSFIFPVFPVLSAYILYQSSPHIAPQFALSEGIISLF